MNIKKPNLYQKSECCPDLQSDEDFRAGTVIFSTPKNLIPARKLQLRHKILIPAQLLFPPTLYCKQVLKILLNNNIKKFSNDEKTGPKDSSWPQKKFKKNSYFLFVLIPTWFSSEWMTKKLWSSTMRNTPLENQTGISTQYNDMKCRCLLIRAGASFGKLIN